MPAPRSDPSAAEFVDMPWHATAAGEVLARFGTSMAGLPAAEIAARRARFGANVLPEGRRKTVLAVFLHQFKSPFIYLLLVAGAISVGLGEVADAGFIFSVLLLNAAIGTFQEWRAETRARALTRLVQSYVVVRRDGARRRIDGRELVPGDVIEVESGLKVPADARLLGAEELSADESLLTGESTPVTKGAARPVAAEAVLADRTTMLHAGSTVLAGRGAGVVVATGAATQIGRIAASLATTPAAEPPLLLRMARFTRFVAIVMVAVIAALALIEIGRGAGLAEVFLLAVALAVSAIPEGLPVAMTIALSIAVSRMASRHVVVRVLPAVEGLGACTLIASDKTGTLTRNELTVWRLWLPELGELNLDGGGAPWTAGEEADPVLVDALRRLALAGALCNEASLGAGGDDGRAVGDTVDIAFLRFAAGQGLRRETLDSEYPELGAVRYEPQRRYAASFRRQDGRGVAHAKGAAETILPMCRNVPADAEAAVMRLAADGFRVLAVAAGPVAAAEAGSLRGLDLLGLVGLIDPLRPEAAGAVQRCREAGVTVCMVTGDHPLTALAISRDLGLARSPDQVVTGAELSKLDGVAFDAAVARGRVFARIEPLQKLAIVEAMQRQGHFVAVTGDGVNDAPALRAASIGVAMGRAGTDVARDASDLILTDDNFASIVNGIEEGRVAYDNVRKVIYLVIATGAAEILLFLLAVAFGLPAPLTAVQLLWLNLVTNGIQDVALAFEKGEPGVLTRRPRPPAQPIFDRQMIEQVLVSGGWTGLLAFLFYAWALDAGWSHAAAQNALLWLVICFENAHAFNCRSERRSVLQVPFANNRFLVLGVLGAQGVHVAAMLTPGLSDVLGIAPLAPLDWLVLLAVAATLVPLMELYKTMVRRRDAYSTIAL